MRSTGILLDSKGFADADAPLPLYFRTTEEMLEEFSYLGKKKGLRGRRDQHQSWPPGARTLKPPAGRPLAPKLENSAEELNSLVWGKAHELYGEDPPQIVKDRIDMELRGIISRKYDVIYMSAQKLVRTPWSIGYLVGSRGSVGSSLVAFMSGITEVNSLPPHYRCPKCKHADFDAGAGYGCGADMPDKICPSAARPMSRTASTSPLRRSWATAATRCRIST